MFATAGDIAAAASASATFRARHQNARQPRTHIWNRSARTGNFRQPAATNMPCKIGAQRVRYERQRCAVNHSRARHQARQFCRQRGKLRLRNVALRMYDDVSSCSYLQTMAAHNFPHAPPDAIAHNRPAQRLLDAESKSAVRQFIRAKKNGEVGIRAALPGAVYGVKISAPHQPRLTRKIQSPRPKRE